MEEPTQRTVEETIAFMESCLMDVEDTAKGWRERTAKEDLRSKLADVELDARRLCYLVGRLDQPAGK